MPPVIRPRRMVTIDDQREVARPRTVPRSPVGGRGGTPPLTPATTSVQQKMTKYAQKKAVAEVVLPGMNRATMQMEMFEEETVNAVRSASGSRRKADAFLSARSQGLDEDETRDRNGTTFIQDSTDYLRELNRRFQTTNQVDPLNPTVSILFGGSQGYGNLTSPGPDPSFQTPVWAEIADKIVSYPGVPSEGRLVVHQQDSA